MTSRYRQRSVVVEARGPATARELDYARSRISALRYHIPGGQLWGIVDLVVREEGASEFPIVVRAELDVGGRVLRARAAAPSVRDAVDLVEAKLRDRVERMPDDDRADGEQRAPGGPKATKAADRGSVREQAHGSYTSRR